MTPHAYIGLPEPTEAEPELQPVTLSNDESVYYQNSLVTWISHTRESNNLDDINAIRALWDDESWESIQAKLDSEASTWHVWWIDGVSRYAAIDKAARAKDDAAAVEDLINRAVRRVSLVLTDFKASDSSRLRVIFSEVIREARST